MIREAIYCQEPGWLNEKQPYPCRASHRGERRHKTWNMHLAMHANRKIRCFCAEQCVPVRLFTIRAMWLFLEMSTQEQRLSQVAILLFGASYEVWFTPVTLIMRMHWYVRF